ncbi:MAG: ammonium transporter, partial [Micromonosporaceae bacterium]|nr:ammonium transporter [Micromonosporaceae bacterium]
GFVAAAVIGPRLARDRAKPLPNNLMMVAAGAGILWLGWNGFNGGDMYFGGMNASAAVLNTNLATAVALLTWVIWDIVAGPQRKPTFLGAINGMIAGLVAITPAAGYVDGLGAIVIGLVASTIVWLTWNKLSKVWIFKKVDDALGVVHTHGFAGLAGGLLVGLLANPHMMVYLPSADGKTAGFSTTGAFFGNPKLILLQLGAAGTIIFWDGLWTFLILRFIGLFMKLRLPDEVLETGDLGVHDEEVYPSDELVGAGAGSSVPAPAKSGSAAAPAQATASE